MLVRGVVCILVLTLVTARRFNNPVLEDGDGDYPDPAALKVGDRYYVVSTTNNESPNKFPISTSTDLQNWQHAGYLFNETNRVPWSDTVHEYWAPEIHQVGDKFVSYFVARQTQPTMGDLYIGVASSANPAGPYISAAEPLWRPTGEGAIDATLMKDNGTLYLVWRGHANYIEARRLNDDGLSFVNPTEETAKLFNPTFDWEGGQVEGPWYTRHGRYHYIFYSGQGTCSDDYAIGVARSLNALGPYEKFGPPILKKTALLLGPGHNSVVKDVDGESDVIVYHARRFGLTCEDAGRPTCVSSLGWGDDEWPYVYDNE